MYGVTNGELTLFEIKQLEDAGTIEEWNKLKKKLKHKDDWYEMVELSKLRWRKERQLGDDNHHISC